MSFSGHMHKGINGAALNRRFVDLSKFAGELIVTEFDVDSQNMDLRAEDVEDFYRVAFSQPKVTGIITWSWVRYSK